MNLDWAKDYWQAPLSGALGGVVRALTLKMAIGEAMSGIIVGSICAVYLNPLGVPLIERVLDWANLSDLSDADRIGLSGFLIGMGGLAASAFFLDIWKRLRSHQRNPRRRTDQ